MIKVMIYECCENEPYLLNLKEQINHLWIIDILKGLEAFHSQKVAQSWF